MVGFCWATARRTRGPTHVAALAAAAPIRNVRRPTPLCAWLMSDPPSIGLTQVVLDERALASARGGAAASCPKSSRDGDNSNRSGCGSSGLLQQLVNEGLVRLAGSGGHAPQRGQQSRIDSNGDER